MLPIEFYRNKPQTYLKHFFLEHYLERVAYNIFSFSNYFVYVDGFSGPWKSEDEKFEDTSFVIALNKLEKIKQGFLEKQGKIVNYRCLFIEKKESAFRELKIAVSNFKSSNVEILNGEFEDCIPQIINYIDQDFALIFIDPTGWAGFSLLKINDLFHDIKCEIIINFMFVYINRYFTEEGQHPTISKLLALDDWKPLLERYLEEGLSREEAILKIYTDQIKNVSGSKLVTSTRILDPLAKRTYFYLVYITSHFKGLLEFRNVEEKAFKEQELIRYDTQQLDRISRTGQTELFEESVLHEDEELVKAERGKNKNKAEGIIRKLYQGNSQLNYDFILEKLLDIPLVSNRVVGQIILKHRDDNLIEILGMSPKERTLKHGRGHVIKMKG